MKQTHIMAVALLAATTAVQGANTEHKLFAKWSDEMMAEAAAADALPAKQANSASTI